MVLDTHRSALTAQALSARQRILAFIRALEGGGNLKLITSLVQIRLDSAAVTFLDEPSSAHLAAIIAIENDLLRIAATLAPKPGARSPAVAAWPPHRPDHAGTGRISAR